MVDYTLIKKSDGNILTISRSDGAFIPTDPANMDYQQYLEDVAIHGPYPEVVME